jgi:hypothetical protein
VNNPFDQISENYSIEQQEKDPSESAQEPTPQSNTTNNYYRDVYTVNGDLVGKDKLVGDKVLGNKTTLLLPENNRREAKPTDTLLLPNDFVKVLIYQAEQSIYSEQNIYNLTVIRKAGINQSSCSWRLYEGKINQIMETHESIFKKDSDSLNTCARLNRFYRMNGELRTHALIKELLETISSSECVGCEDPILEIHDRNSTLSISWESIEIIYNQSSQKRILLGNKFQIVRCNTENTPENHYDSQHTYHQCRGNVMAYTRKENHYLNGTYTTNCFLESFLDFIIHFHNPGGNDYGLATINATEDINEISGNPSGYITNSSLRNIIIMIEGRLRFPQSIDLNHEEAVRLFHEYCATGVVSESITVSQLTSSKMSIRLIELLTQDSLTIPLALKKVRESAYKAFTANPGDRSICDFYIGAYHYIYHGSPFAVLQLDSSLIEA